MKCVLKTQTFRGKHNQQDKIYKYVNRADIVSYLFVKLLPFHNDFYLEIAIAKDAGEEAHYKSIYFKKICKTVMLVSGIVAQ